MRIDVHDPDALDEALRQASRRGDRALLRELTMAAYHAIYAAHGGRRTTRVRRAELRLARSILCHVAGGALLQQGGFDPEPLDELVRSIRVESAVALVEPLPIDLTWSEEAAMRWARESVARVLELWVLGPSEGERLEHALELAADVAAGRRDERLAVRVTDDLDRMAQAASEVGALASAWVARGVRCALRATWRGALHQVDAREVCAFYAADAAECAVRLSRSAEAGVAERRWQRERLVELLTSPH